VNVLVLPEEELSKFRFKKVMLDFVSFLIHRYAAQLLFS
jgi:hypothetical protein